MRLLVDTHVVIWMLASPELLMPEARETLTDPANTIIVSAISIWEIGIKHALRRRDSPPFSAQETLDYLKQIDVEFLGFDEMHAALGGDINRTHGDPFDHALAAQARRARIPIISRDRMLAAYDVEILPA
jgi:PIN domain nuclease of toxin-antitoxin system